MVYMGSDVNFDLGLDRGPRDSPAVLWEVAMLGQKTAQSNLQVCRTMGGKHRHQ